MKTLLLISFVFSPWNIIILSCLVLGAVAALVFIYRIISRIDNNLIREQREKIMGFLHLIPDASPEDIKRFANMAVGFYSEAFEGLETTQHQELCRKISCLIKTSENHRLTMMTAQDSWTIPNAPIKEEESLAQIAHEIEKTILRYLYPVGSINTNVFVKTKPCILWGGFSFSKRNGLDGLQDKNTYR